MHQIGYNAVFEANPISSPNSDCHRGSQANTASSAMASGAGRMAHLESLSEEYGVPLETVLVLADTLGPNEDFDGLVTELEDYADMFSLAFGSV